MNLWIAFFRGINVGGRRILPMKTLQALLLDIGCKHVRTYVQSGNAIFRHSVTSIAELEEQIDAAVTKEFGFEPRVLLLTLEHLRLALSANPFLAVIDKPKNLQLYFLSEVPSHIDEEGIDADKADSENYRLIERVFYLYAPNGIGRSRLAARVEDHLGVSATARNLRTSCKVLALAEELAGES